MTPEKLDEARAKEAVRIWSSQPLPSGEVSAPAAIAARLARENWTPPEPVDPDILAFREFAAQKTKSASLAKAYLDGDLDSSASARLFLAGARMAREQERERADMPIRMAKELLDRLRHLHVILSIIDVEFAEKVEAEIAKYRGEA